MPNYIALFGRDTLMASWQSALLNPATLRGSLGLIGLATDLAHSGDAAFFRSMGDKAFGTLEWMDRDGDADGDGFYEYQTRAGAQGTKNQGWKDSGQAILHANGRMVADPIAVWEVQGLYFAAKQAMGLAFMAVGEHGHGTELPDLQRAAPTSRSRPGVTPKVARSAAPNAGVLA